jgi:hypothetical protein
MRRLRECEEEGEVRGKKRVRKKESRKDESTGKEREMAEENK